MIEESHVRKRLIAFLRGDLSLDQFEDWLVASSWNMHRDSSLEAQDLVWGIELALSEYSSDHLSRAELRDEFIGLLDHITLSIEVRDNAIVDRPRPGVFGTVSSILDARISPWPTKGSLQVSMGSTGTLVT